MSVYTIQNANAMLDFLGAVPNVCLARSVPRSQQNPAAFALPVAQSIPSRAHATADTMETVSRASIVNNAIRMQMQLANSAFLEVLQILFAAFAIQDTMVTVLHVPCVSSVASMPRWPLVVLGEDISIRLNADVILGSMAMGSIVYAAKFVISMPQHLKYVMVPAKSTK